MAENEIKSINGRNVCDQTARDTVNNITVPTKTSDLTNDNGFATETYVTSKIDDTTTATNKTWSSSKIDSQIKDIVNQVGTETLPTTSQTLKGSISELFQFVSNGKQLIATAITDMGINASSDDTFEQLANKILSINVVIDTFGNLSLDNDNYEIYKTENANINICLDSAPSTNQTVSLSLVNNYITLDKNELTFTPQNYNTPQVVTITGSNVGIEHITISTNNKNIDVVVGVLDYDPNIVWETITGDEISANIIGDKCYITSLNTTKEYAFIPSTITYNGTNYTKVTLFGSPSSDTKKTLIGFKCDKNLYSDSNTKWDFSNCTSLRYVVDLPNINSIPSFTGCTSLLSLPKMEHITATSLGKCNGCSNLKVISKLPATLTGAGTSCLSQTFWNCNNVKDISNIVIPSNVTSLHETFSIMTNLTKGILEFHEGVISAKSYCYKNHIDELTIKNKNWEEASYNSLFTNSLVTGNIIVNSYIDSTIFGFIKSSVCLQNAGGTPKPLFKDINKSKFNKICCWGDSLTMGQGVTPNYPTALRDLCDEKTLVYCYGIGGSSLEQISTRMDTFNKQLDDGIHIIWGGTNTSPAMSSVDSYKEYVKTMIAKLNTDKYIIMTPVYKGYNPEYDSAFTTEFGNHFFSLKDWFDNNSYTISDYIMDGTHFNADGNNLIAQAVKEKLTALKYI